MRGIVRTNTKNDACVQYQAATDLMLISLRYFGDWSAACFTQSQRAAARGYVAKARTFRAKARAKNRLLLASGRRQCGAEGEGASLGVRKAAMGKVGVLGERR